MTSVTTGSRRFRPGTAARYLPDGLLLWISGAGVIGVAIGAAGLATTSHPSAVIVVVFVVIIVASLAGMIVLVPRGLANLRTSIRSEPVLEVDGSVLRLGRPGEPQAEVELGRVVRAEYTYRRRNNPPPTSTLRLYDAGGTRLASWNLFPYLGPAIPRWLRQQGIETTATEQKL